MSRLGFRVFRVKCGWVFKVAWLPLCGVLRKTCVGGFGGLGGYMCVWGGISSSRLGFSVWGIKSMGGWESTRVWWLGYLGEHVGRHL